MNYFDKQYATPGTSPGDYTLSEPTASPATISLMSYQGAQLREQQLGSIEEYAALLDNDSINWIHIQGDLSQGMLDQISQVFHTHALALEDIVNTGQRPKVHDYEDQLFVVMMDVAVDEHSVGFNQISLIAGDNYLVSHAAGVQDIFTPVRRRIRNTRGKHRSKGVDYLLYSLLDVVIDRGYPALDFISDRLEDLEKDLLADSDQADLPDLHRLRRDLLFIKRMLWPHREVINSLLHDDSGFITESQFHYYRDCYDHATQLIELVETYRETTTALVDLHISNSNYKLNQIMRVLAIIATIFMPLTFIVGVYGMNFGADSAHRSPWAMPELDWYYGYPLVWLVLIGVMLGMVVYFWRKKWF